jgi:hypothetical protein
MGCLLRKGDGQMRIASVLLCMGGAAAAFAALLVQYLMLLYLMLLEW